MAQQQTNNATTNTDHQTIPVSFSDVSLETLQKSFNDTYKVSKGSASQVVLGFRSMASRLQDPQNEYQQELYPRLKQMCVNIFNKYNESFLTTFSSDVERQVYGANLNGNRNSGSLYRSIPSGVNRNLTYNYAQFGQLLRVLSGRLKFIVNRDAGSVQRYKSSTDETGAYHQLQTKSTEFITYLETVSTEWDTFVTDTRTKFSVEETREKKDRVVGTREQRPRQHHTSPNDERPREQRPRQKHTSPNDERPREQRPRQNHTSPNDERPRRQYKPVRKTESTSEQTNENDGEWKQVTTRKVHPHRF